MSSLQPDKREWYVSPAEEQALAGSNEVLQSVEDSRQLHFLVCAVQVIKNTFNTTPTLKVRSEDLLYVYNLLADAEAELADVLGLYRKLAEIEFAYWALASEKAEAISNSRLQFEEREIVAHEVVRRSLWSSSIRSEIYLSQDVQKAIHKLIVGNLYYLDKEIYSRLEVSKTPLYLDEVFLTPDSQEIFWEEMIETVFNDHDLDFDTPTEVAQHALQFVLQDFSVAQVLTLINQIDPRKRISVLWRLGFLEIGQTLEQFSSTIGVSRASVYRYLLSGIQDIIGLFRDSVPELPLEEAHSLLDEVETLGESNGLIYYSDGALIPINSSHYQLALLSREDPDLLDASLTHRQKEILHFFLKVDKHGRHPTIKDIAIFFDITTTTVNTSLFNSLERIQSKQVLVGHINRRVPRHSAQYQLLTLLQKQPNLLEVAPLTDRQRQAVLNLLIFDDSGRLRNADVLSSDLGLSSNSSMNGLLARALQVMIETIDDGETAVYRSSDGVKLLPNSSRPHLIGLVDNKDLYDKLTDLEREVLRLASELHSPSVFQYSSSEIAQEVGVTGAYVDFLVSSIIQVSKSDKPRYINREGTKIEEDTIQETLITLFLTQGVTFTRELTDNQYEILVLLTEKEDGRFNSINQVGQMLSRDPTLIRMTGAGMVKKFKGFAVNRFLQALNEYVGKTGIDIPYYEEVNILIALLEDGEPFGGSSSAISWAKVIEKTGLSNYSLSKLRKSIGF